MTTTFTEALRKLNALPTSANIRYNTIAKKLNMTPVGRNNKVLKVGSKAYKEYIQRETIKQANAISKPKNLLQGIKAKVQSKPKKQGELTKNQVVREKAPVNKQVPKRMRVKQEDIIKNFEKKTIFYSGITSLDELYEAIIKELEESEEGLNFVSLAYKSKYGNKIKWIGIKNEYLGSFANFKNRIDNIASGQYGSDAIDNEEEELVMDEFVINTISIKGKGSSLSMIFNVEGIESKKGLCAFECLKKCGVDFKGDKKELTFFQILSEYIQTNNLPISIIANSFTTKCKYMDIINRATDYKEIKLKNKKGFDDLYCMSKVLEEDINIVYLVDNRMTKEEDITQRKPFGKYTIIYDETNLHYDIIPNNNPVLRDDVFISRSGNVFKGEQKLFTPKQLNTNSTHQKYKSHLEYVVFDYETVIDFETSSCMKPYSLSILVLPEDQMVKLEHLDRLVLDKDYFDKETGMNALSQIAEIRAKQCITFLGYDCSERFIEWIMATQAHKSYCFIGFNNANFDNFLFLEALLNNMSGNLDAKYSVSDIFYNGSQLLDFRINGRHSTFDIHKHLMGSLKANCESFKINACSKKEFDHHKAQCLYEDGKLLDFIMGNEELREYNEYDVMATAVLFQKYRLALDTIPATQPYAKDIILTKTIGSLIYKVFSDSKKKKGYNLPKLEFKEYSDLQKSKIAGRVELFNGVQKVEERLVSTDVCSLYPYVMSVHNCYYPTGKEIKKVEEYQGDDVIGFYYCDIDQSILKEKNLPNIYAKKSDIENDWDYDGVLENYLISNVMIGLLKQHGCKVVIKNGFVFPEKRKSCEMFDFLLDFMSAKNNQDTLKSSKNDTYNPALRETLKLLMNALSGKVIEGLHTEKTIDINNSYEYLELKDKAKSINFINTIGSKLFLTYEVDAEDICSKEQRPIYLGVLIYDYAKRYMFNYSYSKVGKSRLLYTDTDASKFRYKHFLKWKQWVDDKNIQVPHWKEVEAIDPRYKNHKIYEEGSKVFGAFEDELEDYVGDDYVFYCLEKKSWLYGWSKDGKQKSKFRFKGINGNAQLLTLEEDFILEETVKHKAKEDAEAWEETKYRIDPDRQKEVYMYYNANKQNSLDEGNQIKFFDQVYETGEAYVLCNSFRKIVKNSGRDVEMEDTEKHNTLMNKIQVQFMMKHINLNKRK